MAKQKTASGKKTSKTKAVRTAVAQPAKTARKRSSIVASPESKTAAKKKSPATSTKSTVVSKPAEPKKAVRTAKSTKTVPATKAQSSATKPAAKPASKAVAPKVKKTIAKPAPAPKTAPIAAKKETPVGAKPREAVVKTAKTPARNLSTAEKAKMLSRPLAPRIGNGQVAGVLQAARSVASRTTKVVEVEKERKSHLTADELAEFRQVLLDKRRELVDDMVNLEDEARRTSSDGGSSSSAMPIHMADLGSDTWEQEFTLNLIEKERTIVREIDEALDRIEKKTYGTCLATGKAISKARLRVKPWAKYCIEYARKRELGLT